MRYKPGETQDLSHDLDTPLVLGVSNAVLAFLLHQGGHDPDVKALLACPDRTIDVVIYLQSMEAKKTTVLRLGGEQRLPPPPDSADETTPQSPITLREIDETVYRAACCRCAARSPEYPTQAGALDQLAALGWRSWAGPLHAQDPRAPLQLMTLWFCPIHASDIPRETR